MYVKQLAKNVKLDTDIPESWYRLLTRSLVTTTDVGYNRFLFESNDHHRTQMWSFFVTIISSHLFAISTQSSVTTISSSVATVLTQQQVNNNYYVIACCLWKIWNPQSTVVGVVKHNSGNDSNTINCRLNDVEKRFVDSMVELSQRITNKRKYYWQVDTGTVLPHSEVAVVSCMTDMIELCINMHVIGIKTINVKYVYNKYIFKLDITSLDFEWLSRYPLQVMVTNNTKRSKKSRNILCLGLPPVIGNSLQFWFIQLWFQNCGNGSGGGSTTEPNDSSGNNRSEGESSDYELPVPFVKTLLDHCCLLRRYIPTQVTEVVKPKVTKSKTVDHTNSLPMTSCHSTELYASEIKYEQIIAILSSFS